MSNLENQVFLLKEEVEKIKTRNQSLEDSVTKIHLRNKRVEADKAWELSKTRTIFIAISIYLLILIFMILINDDHPFLNAFVASVGYLISTASYGILKKYWLIKNEPLRTPLRFARSFSSCSPPARFAYRRSKLHPRISIRGFSFERIKLSFQI